MESVCVVLQTDRYRLCNRKLMGAGIGGIMQSDLTRRAIKPAHIAAANGGRRIMGSRDMTEERHDNTERKRERKTIGPGVKWRILEFSEQRCSIYASLAAAQSNMPLC